MQRYNRIPLVFAFLASWSIAVFSQGTIENPVYKSWAKFKVGTNLTYKQVADMAGTRTESEVIYKLMEITPEKAVVEMSGTLIVMGNKTPMPPTKIEHPAKIEKGKEPATPPSTLGKPQIKEASEEVEILGKKIKCHLLESTVRVSESSVLTKVWSNDEIPGTLVKSETLMEKPIRSVTSIELIGQEIK